MAANVTIPVLMFGGQGNDILRAGRGPSLLSGEAGNDQLFAGIGRALHLGGTGSDRLNGSTGEGIFIGGTTSHDTNLTALAAIMAEWSSGNSYDTRVNNLTNGTGLAAGFALRGPGAGQTEGGVGPRFRAAWGDRHLCACYGIATCQAGEMPLLPRTRSATRLPLLTN